ncbi:MAG: PKD domain-containing protein, partial [Candidatus Nanoarchaeia archaeon]|nr:PKD domain-containing protein [Candidatus Nanoarchaeia archaeon]
TPNPVTINNSVSFDASSSTDQNIGTFLSDSIVSYNWDFGDGNIGSGQTVSHNYTSTGTFNVNLTVTDSYNESSSTSSSVTVNAPGSNPPPSGGGSGGGGGGGGGGSGGASNLIIQLTPTPASIFVGVNSKLSFNFEGIRYQIVFDAITKEGAAISITPPTPADQYALPINQPIKIDLNKDDIYDLLIVVTDYQFGRVKVTLQLIQEFKNPVLPIIIPEPEPEPEPVEEIQEPVQEVEPKSNFLTGFAISDLNISTKNGLLIGGSIIAAIIILILGRAIMLFGPRRFFFRIRIFGLRRALRL